MVDFVKFKKSKSDDLDEPEKPQEKKKWKFSFKRFLLYFVGFMFLTSIISSVSLSMSPKIAVVPIKGVIMTSSDAGSLLSGGSGTSSRDISEQLYGFLSDSSVKAIVLDINSPGGSPVASEEISKAIDAVSEEIPVYSVVSDTGASGAFWVAMSADKVFASSMSTLGSIGVTSAGLSFENFIEEWNVSYRRLTAGEFKDMGSPFREMTNEESEKFQKVLDEVHSSFISHVADARNLSYEHVLEDSTGEIFLGNYAKSRGYVDEIGNYRDVIVELKNEFGNETLVLNYGPNPSLFSGLGVESKFDSFVSQNYFMLR